MEQDEEAGGFKTKKTRVIVLGTFIGVTLCLSLFVTAVAGDRLHWLMIGFYTLALVLLFFAILLLMLEIGCFHKKIHIPSMKKKSTANISFTEGGPRTNSEIPYDVGDGMNIPGEIESDSFDSSSDSDAEGKGEITFRVTVDKAKEPSVKSNEFNVDNRANNEKTYSMNITKLEEDAKSTASRESNGSDSDHGGKKNTFEINLDRKDHDSLSVKSSDSSRSSDSDRENESKMDVSKNGENAAEAITK